MHTLPSLMLCGLFAGAPIAAGAVMPPYPPPVEAGQVGADFEELDRDADGMLTPDELPPNHELSASFAQHDDDADNRLSRAEFAAYLGGSVAQADDDADSGSEDGEPPGP